MSKTLTVDELWQKIGQTKTGKDFTFLGKASADEQVLTEMNRVVGLLYPGVVIRWHSSGVEPAEIYLIRASALELDSTPAPKKTKKDTESAPQ